jgi:Leucine-rich repeat (LRR) protein
MKYIIILTMILVTLNCAKKQVDWDDLLKDKDTIQELSLGKRNIPVLPDTIGEFTLLRKLDLGYSNVAKVSAKIGDLKNIDFISLYGNELVDLPIEMQNLKSLKKLYLGKNKFSKIPDALAGMEGLIYLSIDENPLILDEKGVEILSNLKNLEVLDLSECKTLVSVPSNLSKLNHFKKIYFFKHKLPQSERVKVKESIPNVEIRF